MDFSELDNEQFYEYGLGMGSVHDWWRVTGMARKNPKGFAPFAREWERVKKEIYKRDMQDEFRI